MIAAISWVRKGVAKSFPDVAEPPSKEEIDEILKCEALDGRRNSETEEDDEDMDTDAATKVDKVVQALGAADAVGRTSSDITSGTNFRDITDGLRELDMEHYDEEDDGIELFSTGLGDTYYPSNEVDPFLKDDNDSEDLEDMAIKAEDGIIVCARTEDEMGHLEVWILEESSDGDSNMYVHHDIIIPAFPLCTAWLDCPLKTGEKGNFIAVGSMEPSIEIWDLDMIDEVQPHMVLGGIAEKKKKKKKSIKYKKDSHTDSVLGLAWNKEFRNILASGSADKLVKIWDVATGKCETTMEHHTGEVQAVAWNHHVPQVLLSGSFDRSVVMKDGRVPSHTGFKWSVTADFESLAWDPHVEHSFVVSLGDGTVKGFDIRTATSEPTAESKPTFNLHAHDKVVCTVSYNPSVRNFLATGSQDKMVKLWDLSDNQPKCVASKNPELGAVFSISFSEDSPFLLAMGGSKGRLEVWDTSTVSGVSRLFGKNINQNRS
ncbi:uncharacterized WD repeat-containing protein C17D11.16-like [Malania oleifera]|uniref:uncharacterized WD repeat-containing protein C17D11.16-like n=1 Tax=Malania oleifera TaxID=397392 RepID=UPI0025AE7000|nr:uncharacterized WD repeat-containing protein C17D11.16-like [Malania oleifera]